MIYTNKNAARRCRGSALILTVVLTVLLGAIGVFFVMASRIDRMASASAGEDFALDNAVDSVTHQIGVVLWEDLFGEPEKVAQSLLGDPCETVPDTYFNLLAPPSKYEYEAGASDPNKFIPSNYADYSFGNEPWDSPVTDTWLASLEPDSGTTWPYITDIYGTLTFFGIRTNLPCQIVSESDPAIEYRLADADGDGVSDSLWILLENVQGSAGEDVYAAVRIIDNCGMLNLNTAYRCTGTSSGEYLSSVDYERFLRGDDRGDPCCIRDARDPASLYPGEQAYHDNVIMNIEDPPDGIRLFGLDDELEIRNRYLLTSLIQARFEAEDVAYATFDWGRGQFVPGWNTELRVKRLPFETGELNAWQWRVDPFYFDDTSGASPTDQWKYDRRHVCTFYSFDRHIRRRDFPNPADPNGTIHWALHHNDIMPSGPDRGAIPLTLPLTISDPEEVMMFLYAFRGYFINQYGDDVVTAAQKAAQVVTNLIDYNDPNTQDEPTTLNDILLNAVRNSLGLDGAEYDFDLGGATICGFERQPFISELFYVKNADDSEHYGLELCNPYDHSVDLSGWQIIAGGATVNFPFGGSTVVPAAPAPGQLGRLTILTDGAFVPVQGGAAYIDIGLQFAPGQTIRLQRRDMFGSFVVVDSQDLPTLPTVWPDTSLNDGSGQSLKRDDTNNHWRFVDNTTYQMDTTNPKLGQSNGYTDPNAFEYQLPVADNEKSIETLSDFLKILKVGPSPTQSLTDALAGAGSESDIRFDLSTTDSQLFDYFCMLRSEQGTLPGRINLNTATREVIRAAIPDSTNWNYDLMSQRIESARPFSRITNLLNVNGMQVMADPASPDMGDPIRGDIEESHWIFSTVVNKFTVRSDTFTAWILVRIGENGPQRRVLAIFDRRHVDEPGKWPRIVAFHPVPDVR